MALIRQHMGWNAKEAAIACNFPPASWREWETLGRIPRDLPEVAEKISDRTGVDDYWIMTGREKGPRPVGPGTKLRQSTYSDGGSRIVIPMRRPARSVDNLATVAA